MMPEHRIGYMHSTEKARDNTFNDENYGMHYREGRPIGTNLTDNT